MQIDPKSGERIAVVRKSNYQRVFAVGQVVRDLSWDLFKPIIKREIAVDEITNDVIFDLFAKTGREKSALGAWFTEKGFAQRDGRWVLNAEEKHRAASLLRSEIEERESAVVA
jgi:hypothetical protein